MKRLYYYTLWKFAKTTRIPVPTELEITDKENVRFMNKLSDHHPIWQGSYVDYMAEPREQLRYCGVLQRKQLHGCTIYGFFAVLMEEIG